MACTKQYLNLAGAGLCAAGGAVGVYASGIGTIVSGGTATPAMIATAVASGLAMVGSILWAASGYMDLADCLAAAGRSAEADAMRARSQGLRADAEAIQQQIDRLQALVA
jgi:hypothetical protein